MVMRTRNGVSLRPAGPEDAEGYRNAVRAVGQERRYLATIDGYSLNDTTAYLTRLRAENSPALVAVADAGIVGWCDICRRPGVGFAHAGTLGMGVVRQWRGQGIGRQLMEQSLALARDSGFERIELIVYSDNEAAKRLYDSVGFKLEGTKQNARKIDGQYQDELVMALCF